MERERGREEAGMREAGWQEAGTRTGSWRKEAGDEKGERRRRGMVGRGSNEEGQWRISGKG